jgi:hypothetical protein
VVGLFLHRENSGRHPNTTRLAPTEADTNRNAEEKSGDQTTLTKSTAAMRCSTVETRRSHHLDSFCRIFAAAKDSPRQSIPPTADATLAASGCDVVSRWCPRTAIARARTIIAKDKPTARTLFCRTLQMSHGGAQPRRWLWRLVRLFGLGTHNRRHTIARKPMSSVRRPDPSLFRRSAVRQREHEVGRRQAKHQLLLDSRCAPMTVCSRRPSDRDTRERISGSGRQDHWRARRGALFVRALRHRGPNPATSRVDSVRPQ